ncbi:homeodomain transcription factor [Mycena galericulata]|nr:homeodomain transcription factor [Mycena galericulata]
MPPKKRHRHSPAQLAALNSLYDQTEHPTLDQRIQLAQSIGLQTKSVNSFFQNRRSTKKQPRGVHYISKSSADPNIDHLEDDAIDSPAESATKQSFQSDPPDPSDATQSLSPSENMPQRMRLRPSADQVAELQKTYVLNTHPTTDERQVLADSIGMRYQSVTNWFQNQRSLAKKHKDEGYEGYADPEEEPSRAFPPAPDQPSLTERGRRSPSSSVADDGLTSRSRRASSRRSATPYGSSSAVSLSSRQRRARPEPRQLDALKELFSKTPQPSIEERSALALEIGMEIGKVTNWFRNLRQSARKREKKLGGRRSTGSDDDLDYTDGYGTGFYSPSVSASVSRSGTPSSSLEREDGRPRRIRPQVRLHSSDDDEEDEEDAQEAVTPSPSQSPSPASSPSHPRILDLSVAAALHDAMVLMKAENKHRERSDEELAHALLLLEFQATCR